MTAITPRSHYTALKDIDNANGNNIIHTMEKKVSRASLFSLSMKPSMFSKRNCPIVGVFKTQNNVFKKPLLKNENDDDDTSQVSNTEEDYQQKKGCLKNTSKKNRKRKKKVSFKLSNSEVFTVSTLFEYASDLWWSSDDIQQFRRLHHTILNPALGKKAEGYIHAYFEGREKLENPYSKIVSSTKELPFSPDIYDAIVMGRMQGFAGLEMYSKVNIQKRKQVENIISKISSLSQEQIVLGKKISKRDNTIGSFAVPCTLADRSWAEVIGKIDSFIATMENEG